MKIKTKKQLNLPQLIEWGFNNPKEVESKVFEADKIDYFWNVANVQFSNDGYGVRVDSSVSAEDTFTIEVEEEIDEETKLGLLLDHFINPYGQHYVGNIYQNRSINDVLEENDEMEISTNSIHLFDKETKEFILIWRDGKLVE